MKTLMFIWKNKWKILIISVLIAGLFFAESCYDIYYTENMTLSFIYPNSEKGKYPDGTRFNMYDMQSDKVMQATIDAYNEVAPVQITLSDVEDVISIREYLTTSVSSKIDEARDLGIDYSYFANEFNVTFKPVFKLGKNELNDLKNFSGFKPYIDNELFMEKFYESYVNYFMQQHAEKNIVNGLSNMVDTVNFDYIEIANLYTNQVNMCINYLEGKNNENGAFRSTQTGMTFNDLINEFKNLKSVQVKNLTAFVSSSKLTKNPEQFVNKLRVENESKMVTYSKYKSETDLVKEAMNKYDHTFEENIVVAGISETDGLYQTRAKTAYDVITKRAHDAGVKAESLYQEIEENKRLIEQYGSSNMTSEERERLSKVADNMITQIESVNSELLKKADVTVGEYLKNKSSDYVRREVQGKSYINFYIIMKCGFVFIGAAVLSTCLLFMQDMSKKRRVGIIRKTKINKTKNTDKKLFRSKNKTQHKVHKLELDDNTNIKIIERDNQEIVAIKIESVKDKESDITTGVVEVDDNNISLDESVNEVEKVESFEGVETKVDDDVVVNSDETPVVEVDNSEDTGVETTDDKDFEMDIDAGADNDIEIVNKSEENVNIADDVNIDVIIDHENKVIEPVSIKSGKNKHKRGKSKFEIAFETKFNKPHKRKHAKKSKKELNK